MTTALLERYPRTMLALARKNALDERRPLLDRLAVQRPANLHGSHCFNGSDLTCGWPEMHAVSK
jgi:hypothetical protein